MLVFKLNPWFTNTDKRLTKSPKIYFVDSGLLSHLLRLPDTWSFPNTFGVVLENFIVSEILKQCSWEESLLEAYHFRTQNGEEVDLVLQDWQGNIAGVEIKSSATVEAKDFKGLKSLKEIARDRFQSGVILYIGDHIVPFGEKLWAIPLQMLWHTSDVSEDTTLSKGG